MAAHLAVRRLSLEPRRLLPGSTCPARCRSRPGSAPTASRSWWCWRRRRRGRGRASAGAGSRAAASARAAAPAAARRRAGACAGARRPIAPRTGSTDGPACRCGCSSRTSRTWSQCDPVAVLTQLPQVIDLSSRACQPGALVVWPESAAWPFSYGRGPASRARPRRRWSRPRLHGAVQLRHPVGDALLQLGLPAQRPAATLERYDKRHLVPFGEYVPLKRALLVHRTSWRATPATSAPATRARRCCPGRTSGSGLAICYEVVFPDEVAELARAGATVLVTITNDAWYGDTAAPWQHFRAARFRAAENRRPLLRAAITGVSALVGAGRLGLRRSSASGEEGYPARPRGRAAGRHALRARALAGAVALAAVRRSAARPFAVALYSLCEETRP